MDNGVRFVLDNFEKSISICSSNISLVRRIRSEYNIIKYIKTTGNMIEYFDRFIDGHHKYADDFAFLTNYDVLPNEHISAYLKANYKKEAKKKITYKNIEEGSILSHAEIYIYFGGSTRGAVVRKNKRKNFFILVLDNLHNTFYENGDILFNCYGANAKVDESTGLFIHKEMQSKIFVFRKMEKNKYCYLGRYETTDQLSENNGNKYVILKHLEAEYVAPKSIDRFQYLTLDQCADAKYLDVPTTEEKKECKLHSSKRNEKVSSYTKHRANGICDLCGKEAPFKNSLGQPYLECHHVIYIANDGPDRIYNTVALCPNCHKRIHYLGDKADKDILILKIKQYLENDNDENNKLNFNKLFGLNTIN